MANALTSLSLTVFASAVLLSGCGSSSGSSGVVTPAVTVGVEKSFNDEYSIVRVETDRYLIVRYGDMEDNAINEAIVTIYAYLTAINSNQYGRFSEGTVDTVAGEDVEIFSFRDGNKPSTFIDLVTLAENKQLLEVRGAKPTDIPTGIFRYEGTNVFFVVGSRTDNGFGSGMSHGVFRMEVDFTKGSGEIEADSIARPAGGSDAGLDVSRIAGRFDVDSEAGTFSGDAIRVRNPSSQNEFVAVIYGNFHGESAKGVTGIYVEDRSDDDTGRDSRFYGAIAGVIDSQSRAYSVVREFENDYNVVRIKTEDKRLLRYGFGTKNTRRREIVVEHDENLKTVESTDYGSFTKSDVDVGVDGLGKAYSYADDDDSSLYIDLITLAGDDDIILESGDEDLMLEVGGDQNFTIPSGSFTYVGTNIFGVWNGRTENGWGSSTSHGTFNLEVNFDENTGSISASSPTRPGRGTDEGLDGMELSGGLTVNSVTGTFLGNDIEVTNTETDGTFDARINGTFHGEDAVGVTGLYVENHSSPRFFGALAGVKDELRN